MPKVSSQRVCLKSIPETVGERDGFSARFETWDHNGTVTQAGLLADETCSKVLFFESRDALRSYTMARTGQRMVIMPLDLAAGAALEPVAVEDPESWKNLRAPLWTLPPKPRQSWLS